MKAKVNEVRAYLLHFTFVFEWKVFDDIPLFEDTVPILEDHIDLAVIKNHENLPAARHLIVPEDNSDFRLELNVLDPLVLNQVIDRHEGGMWDEEEIGP